MSTRPADLIPVPHTIMQDALADLRDHMALLEPVVKDAEETLIAIAAMESALTAVGVDHTSKPKKSAIKVQQKPNTSMSGSGAVLAPVTDIASVRHNKSMKPSTEPKNKGGRPTKKMTFMKLLKQRGKMIREDIPNIIDTSVAKVNEFVPELVREGLVTLDDNGDKHGPEYVVITDKGKKS